MDLSIEYLHYNCWQEQRQADNKYLLMKEHCTIFCQEMETKFERVSEFTYLSIEKNSGQKYILNCTMSMQSETFDHGQSIG